LFPQNTVHEKLSQAIMVVVFPVVSNYKLKGQEYVILLKLEKNKEVHANNGREN